ncbi:gliding motility-associated C-terminal domain-containing protein [Flavobacterium sp. GP15]|uniref:T9SS type B sorting domain-containing protein n=1 Tax=Flavobacterium sp. GP15 TaxID=2758567 RepID=UPI00165DE46A|nr:gliding motility-associated C-terminal domain-containing protein [Flavobacterium sp. GP15]
MVKKYFSCLLLLVLFLSISTTYSQISIGSPVLNFTQVCADESYNSTAPFKVEFSFSPQSALNLSNQFIVELSDANGSFSSAVILVSSNPGAITTSKGSLNFSFPQNTGGENYKIRVRSTNPAKTSAESVSFSAYYQIQNSPFSINNFVATASYCSGGSYVLKIDNPGTGTNDSPLKYPSLTYKWYKEALPNPILVGTTTSLSVNQPGTYYVETNYGSCTSNSYSNRVRVESASVQISNITSSKGNPFCASQGATTLTSQVANSYQWYLDDVAINGATSITYDANKAGSYSVKVDLGGCVNTSIINLQEIQFNSSINIPDVVTLQEGESKTVIATTTAINPTFQWFKNGIIVPAATSNSYDITTAGDYSLVINQATGCASTKTFNFTFKYPIIDASVTSIPNLISPNGDDINDTWVIPQEYLGGTNTEVQIISASGKQVLKTDNYQNNWPESSMDFKNINPVFYYIITTKDKKVKKGSITLIK